MTTHKTIPGLSVFFKCFRVFFSNDTFGRGLKSSHPHPNEYNGVIFVSKIGVRVSHSLDIDIDKDDNPVVSSRRISTEFTNRATSGRYT